MSKCRPPRGRGGWLFFFHDYFLLTTRKRGCLGRPWDVIELAGGGGEIGQKAESRRGLWRKGVKRKRKKEAGSWEYRRGSFSSSGTSRAERGEGTAEKKGNRERFWSRGKKQRTPLGAILGWTTNRLVNAMLSKSVFMFYFISLYIFSWFCYVIICPRTDISHTGAWDKILVSMFQYWEAS